MTDPTPETGSEPETETEEQPFANRAARRAKGKGSAGRAAGLDGPRQLRSGPVQTPRQYGNRRSG